MSEQSARPREAKGRDDGRISPLEWTASGIGLLLTLGILGMVGWEAVHNGGDALPAIDVAVERVIATPAGYVVEVAATNISPATASAVEIEGKLMRGNEEIAASSATIAYVPGESERKAGLFFKDDPRTHRLEVRALGYEEP